MYLALVRLHFKLCVTPSPWSISREGQRSCEGSGEEVLQGAAEVTGTGEEKAPERTYHSLQLPERSCGKLGVGFFLQMTVIG